MANVIKFVYAVFWLAIAIGVGDALVDATNLLRSEAIRAHRTGPISYKLFTEQLTGQK